MQGFIAAGVGVSLIPRLALRAVRDDVVVRPLDPPTGRHVDAVYGGSWSTDGGGAVGYPGAGVHAELGGELLRRCGRACAPGLLRLPGQRSTVGDRQVA